MLLIFWCYKISHKFCFLLLEVTQPKCWFTSSPIAPSQRGSRPSRSATSTPATTTSFWFTGFKSKPEGYNLSRHLDKKFLTVLKSLSWQSRNLLDLISTSMSRPKSIYWDLSIFIKTRLFLDLDKEIIDFTIKCGKNIKFLFQKHNKGPKSLY